MAVGMVQKSYEIRYTELKTYMHNIYVKGNTRWPKTLSAALDMLVNCKGGKRPPVQNYGSREGFDLKTKGNLGGFR